MPLGMTNYTGPFPPVGSKVTLSVTGELVEYTYGGSGHTGDLSPEVTLVLDNGKTENFDLGGFDEVKVIEPEYEEGAVYRAADGSIWVFGSSDASRPWSTVGTRSRFFLDTPARPLRKLS